MTAAYLDLDRFKEVNDQRGHLEGDAVLRVVGATLREHVRETDIVARLGGDEFAIIFPELDAGAARGVLTSLHDKLREGRRAHGWPVTFSIGVVTFSTPPESLDELLQRTDDVMFTVKRDGRDAIGWAHTPP